MNSYTVQPHTHTHTHTHTHMRTINCGMYVCSITLSFVQCCSDMKEMAVALLLLLGLLCWPLVNSQIFPYVSFRGQTLANHSYVDLRLVGSDSSGSDSVRCISDLDTCCTGVQGGHRGDWYFPDGTKLPFSGDITQNRGARRVDLRRRNTYATSPSGVYRCSIGTNAVPGHHYNSERESVFVGLYGNNRGC